MARCDCDHNIAWVDMTPVDINIVECQVGSKYPEERTGKVVMKFNPPEIQEWILRETGLSCMNFNPFTTEFVTINTLGPF